MSSKEYINNPMKTIRKVATTRIGTSKIYARIMPNILSPFAKAKSLGKDVLMFLFIQSFVYCNHDI